MARIIKFRAWVDNGETVQMFQFGLFDTDEGYSIRHQQSFDGCPIMQFTGLQDKNGKDIYEGDIVSKHVEFYTDPADIGGRTLVSKEIVTGIEFGTYCWVQTKFGTPFDPITARSMEIIGNIYETPNLIKHGN